MKRFTYHQPEVALRGTVYGLKEVRDAQTGERIGLLNPVRNGYALRRLDGHRLDVVYRVGRETAAGLLRMRMQEDQA
jgi:hypothetical protein